MLLIECFYGIPLILSNLVDWAPVIFCHGMEESFKMIVLNRLQYHLSGGYCFCFVVALFNLERPIIRLRYQSVFSIDKD